MRIRAIFAVTAIVMVTAGCSPGAVEPSTTTPSTTAAPATTSVPPSTTAQPVSDPAVTCADIEQAVADLATALEEGAVELSDEPGPALLVDVVARAIGFADALQRIGADAPAEVATALGALAGAFDPWRTALDLSADEVPDRIAEVDPRALTTGRVLDASRSVADWTQNNCGERRELDPDTLLSIAVFDGFAAAYGEFVSEPVDALVYGDDPQMDELWDLCGVGDVASCDELYLTTLSGEYTLWGLTCGAAIPLRSFGLRDCGRKLDLAGPRVYGDDPELDALWGRCGADDPGACDDLYALSPVESEYEARALTCGDSRPPDTRPCAFTSTGDPWTYGDDPRFDALWDACSVGDGVACVDLYFDTPFDSVYEALGDHCGALTEAGYGCETIASWLDVPGG